jgi:hypothetical protein
MMAGVVSEAASIVVDVELEVPGDLSRFSLPEGVARRLKALLDKQDAGDEALTEDERLEAEGLVDLADLLSLLRLRATRIAGRE